MRHPQPRTCGHPDHAHHDTGARSANPRPVVAGVVVTPATALGELHYSSSRASWRQLMLEDHKAAPAAEAGRDGLRPSSAGRSAHHAEEHLLARVSRLTAATIHAAAGAYMRPTARRRAANSRHRWICQRLETKWNA